MTYKSASNRYKKIIYITDKKLKKFRTNTQLITDNKKAEAAKKRFLFPCARL